MHLDHTEDEVGSIPIPPIATPSLATTMSHRYKDYEHLKLWKVLEKGVDRLVANCDLDQKTATHNIIGYLTKLLIDEGLVKEE